MTSIALPAPGQLRLGLVFALAISVGNIIGSGIMRTALSRFQWHEW